MSSHYLIEPHFSQRSAVREKSLQEIIEEEELFYILMIREQEQKTLQEAIKQQQTQEDANKHVLSQQITQMVAIQAGAGAGGIALSVSDLFGSITDSFGSITTSFGTL